METKQTDERLLPIYRYWMLVALWEAGKSADQTTQNAAVILDASEHPREISRGRIEYPGSVDRSDARSKAPEKYFFLEHAERNAIYNAIRTEASLELATMVTPWAPCADCARAIIQSGICTLILLTDTIGTGGAHSRWEESIAAGELMLAEAGVAIRYVELNHERLPRLLRNGKYWP